MGLAKRLTTHELHKVADALQYIEMSAGNTGKIVLLRKMQGYVREKKTVFLRIIVYRCGEEGLLHTSFYLVECACKFHPFFARVGIDVQVVMRSAHLAYADSTGGSAAQEQPGLPRHHQQMTIGLLTCARVTRLGKNALLAIADA